MAADFNALHFIIHSCDFAYDTYELSSNPISVDDSIDQLSCVYPVTIAKEFQLHKWSMTQ
jgi:hypothetical protein